MQQAVPAGARTTSTRPFGGNGGCLIAGDCRMADSELPSAHIFTYLNNVVYVVGTRPSSWLPCGWKAKLA